MVTKDSLAQYHKWYNWASGLWKDKDRPDYEADVWYNNYRNRLALDMIGYKFKDQEVLLLGSTLWVDGALIHQLPHKRALRTDILEVPEVDQVVDVTGMPFPDKSWDAIIAREVIEHLDEPFRMMNEVSRVIRPGGFLFITTTNSFNCLPDGELHKGFISPKQFENLMKLYGFSIVDKRGNVPNIHDALLGMCRRTRNNEAILDEFKELALRFDRLGQDSYYFGSELLILAKKNQGENK